MGVVLKIFMAEVTICRTNWTPPKKKKTVTVILGIEALQWLCCFIRVKLKLLSFFCFPFHFYLPPFLFLPFLSAPFPFTPFLLPLLFLSPRGFQENHCSSFTGPILVNYDMLYCIVPGPVIRVTLDKLPKVSDFISAFVNYQNYI